MRPVLAVDDELLKRELPRLFLRCLGIDNQTTMTQLDSFGASFPYTVCFIAQALSPRWWQASYTTT